jgi:uncharacterized protein (TIGR03435 family)
MMNESEVSRFVRALAILLLVAWSSYAQPSGSVEFDVASIRPSAPAVGGLMTVGCSGGPGTRDPGLFTCQNMTLSNLVTDAWRIDFFRLTAPDWMNSVRFDLRATIPPNTTAEQFHSMLQNMVAERFKLSVHHETRGVTQMNLLVGRTGPKFKQASAPAPVPDEPADTRPAAPRPLTVDKNGFPVLEPNRVTMAIMSDKARLYHPRMTMLALANQLSGQLSTPVTDATALKGEYEIDLYWVAGSGLRSGAPMDDPDPTLVQALQDQLGLRLEQKKGAVDFLVVDHAEKVPTEN